MDEIRNTPEELESGAVRETGQQALDDATYEPSAYIEHGGDFQQAESIQNNFVALTANAAAARDAEQVSSLPLPIPKPVGAAADEEKVGHLPIPLPKPAEETVVEEPPGDHEPLSRAEPPGEEEEDIDKATPINIPGPRMREGRSNTVPASAPENDIIPDTASGGEEEEGNDQSKASEDDWETPIA